MPKAQHIPLLHKAHQLAEMLRTTPEVSRRLIHTEKVWQYRNYQGTDPASMIDWKQSARVSVPIVREHEPLKTKETYFWMSPHDLPKETIEKARLILFTLAFLLTYKERTVGWLSDRVIKANITTDLVEKLTKCLTLDTPTLALQNINNACIVLAADFSKPYEQLTEALRGYAAQGNQLILIHLGEMPAHFPLKVPSLTLLSKTKPEAFTLQLLEKVIYETK